LREERLAASFADLSKQSQSLDTAWAIRGHRACTAFNGDLLPLKSSLLASQSSPALESHGIPKGDAI